MAKKAEIETLIADRVNLKLSEEFCELVQEQLVRFKKEIAFRKQQEEQERIDAELKALKKKKKAK